MVAMETAGLLTMLSLFILSFLIFGLLIHLYLAAVLMTIAKKTNTPHPWLAWIPFANFFLLFMIARLKLWYVLIIAILSLLPSFLLNASGTKPILGMILLIVSWSFITFITTRCWWRIAKFRGRPGWFSLLLFLPLINFAVLGILAWKDVEKNSTDRW